MPDSPENGKFQHSWEADLTNCDREPIHVPGAIQPHGVLLVLQESDLRVLQVSDNTSEFLGIDPTDVLGNSLLLLLGPAQTNSFRQTLSSAELRSRNPIKITLEKGKNPRVVNGIVHRYQGALILELEPLGESAEAPMLPYRLVQAALSRIQTTTTLREMWRVVAEEVQAILGYDRVMIYKFDRSGNGAVIEERVVDGHEPYLGLHYPASDIPQQARTLYKLNYIRSIPDVSYKPADLVPLIFPVTRELTDLGFSVLRSVSPIHIEYLRNMGVAASLSVSLMSGSSLWGLIACHHYSPKFVPYEMRSACEVLGQVVSLRMSALESSEKAEYKSATNAMQAKFLEAISTTDHLKHALIDGHPNLLDYIPAGGAAVWTGQDCFVLGNTPPVDEITKLVRRLRRFASPVFATDELSSVFPETISYKDTASGLLSITISREKNLYLLWFRPEQIQAVNWGGDPNKGLLPDGELRLRPRKSFSLWKEVVANKSLPWAETEVDSATELRSTIMGLLLRRN